MGEYFKKWIREIPDYPKPGILFKDITPLLGDAAAYQKLINEMAEAVASASPTKIIGIESRGFIFGAAIAYKLGVGFALVRKKGKLPSETVSVRYSLEYGEDEMELHKDALSSTDRVVIIDDVLATGGTALAAADLVKKLNAKLVGLHFLIEIEGLGGRKKLADYSVVSVL